MSDQMTSNVPRFGGSGFDPHGCAVRVSVRAPVLRHIVGPGYIRLGNSGRGALTHSRGGTIEWVDLPDVLEHGNYWDETGKDIPYHRLTTENVTAMDLCFIGSLKLMTVNVLLDWDRVEGVDCLYEAEVLSALCRYMTAQKMDLVNFAFTSDFEATIPGRRIRSDALVAVFRGA